MSALGHKQTLEGVCIMSALPPKADIADGNRLGDLRPPELLTLFYRPLKPSIDSLADHAALKLGKGAGDLKHELASRRDGVDRLLVEVQINPAGL